MRIAIIVIISGTVTFGLHHSARAQSADTVADKMCQTADQKYCDNGMEKSCYVSGHERNGRPIWGGTITGQNCVVNAPQRSDDARCNRLQKSFNAGANEWRSRCSYRTAGSSLDQRCRREKAQLIERRTQIRAECPQFPVIGSD